jgi:Protein of unknown function (DUF2971)
MGGGELFHYTTAEGLKGILKSQNLRATHYRHLNDSTEMGVVTSRIVFKFYDELNSFFRSNSAQFGKLNDTLLDQYANKQAKMMYQVSIDQVDAMSPVFMCSLCRHTAEDAWRSGVLSQWRGYGSVGGYCLVFDESEMLKLFDKLEDRQKFSSLQHKLIQYIETEQEIDISRLDGLATELYKNKFNNFCAKGETDNADLNLVPFEGSSSVERVDQLLHMVLEDLPFYKDASFREEQEYRIAAAALTQTIASPEGVPPPYHFDVRGNELVPFVYLFGESNKLPLKRIIVGPGGNGMRRVHGVGQLVRSLGIECDVFQSNIPYV